MLWARCLRAQPASNRRTVPRVLIAWELGAQLGHVLRILGVARELRQRGAAVLIAVRDLRAASATLGQHGFACVQAPSMPAPSIEAAPEPPGYGGMLAACGFGEVSSLRALVQGWDSLIDLFSPQVLLADHAPSALLAARMRALPAAQIALGFELPPATVPLPVLRPWTAHRPADILAQEARLLEVINTLCRERGASGLDRLADLYASAAPLLATVPELDHFGAREGGQYVGPLVTLDDGEAALWPQAAHPGKRIFVYLRPGPAAEHALAAIGRRVAADAGVQVIAVVPGLRQEMAAQFHGERFAVYVNPVRARIALAADLAITNGGHGMTAAALLAGVPLLALPTHVEQWLLAKRVQQLGAGVFLNPNQVETGFAAALGAMLTDDKYRQAARAVAARHAGVNQGATLRRIADEIERISAAPAACAG